MLPKFRFSDSALISIFAGCLLVSYLQICDGMPGLSLSFNKKKFILANIYRVGALKFSTLIGHLIVNDLIKYKKIKFQNPKTIRVH